MADALSLAACVLQMIDFGSKFATTVWKIYTTGKNDDEIDYLWAISTDLNNVLGEVQGLTPNASNKGNEGIVNLAKECAPVLDQVLQSLEKVKPKGPFRKRDAIRSALKAIWKKDEISGLQARLNDFRSQLTLDLLVSLRYYAGQSLDQQEAILAEFRAAQGSPRPLDADFPETLGNTLLTYITSKLNKSQRVQELETLRDEIIQAIRQAPVTATSEERQEILTSEDVRCEYMTTLLASMQYNAMSDRETRISEAHKSTFKWLFEHSSDQGWDNFRDWLSSDATLYWITGKAGSGKSTLMKYICYPKEGQPTCRCERYLKVWSNGKKLAIASFFFWNSGTEMQMKQSGLLISLLSQLLGACPELIPLACPEKWEALCLFGGNTEVHEWDERSLHDALLRAIRNANQLNIAVALFVDGLDEFEGSPDTLISLFQDVMVFSNVKICVASRPWVEFQDAFKHRPSLKLEQLTHNDIMTYVSSRFHEDPMFAKLRQSERDLADEIIAEVVNKASGVFLWVNLVVSSLLAGIGFADRASDLKRRLELLPPDLKQLYEKMILSLDSFYLEHAAQLFALVDSSLSPPDLVVASFADEDDTDFALRREIKAISIDEINLRMDNMRRRINSRTKGLLEVKDGSSRTDPSISTRHIPGRQFGGELRFVGFGDSPSGSRNITVQYLHRTVKDYIQSSEVQRKLQSTMKSAFDPHLRLLSGQLAYIKGTNMDLLRVEERNDHFLRCFRHARSVSPSNAPAMVLLLDELDRVGATVFRPFKAPQEADEGLIRSQKGFWASGLFPPRVQKYFVDNGSGYPFISLAVIFHVVEYVRARSARFGLSQRSLYPHNDDTIPWSLLMDAIELWFVDPQGSGMLLELKPLWDPESTGGPSVPMIQCLLEKGADPTHLVGLNHGTTEVSVSPLAVVVEKLTRNDPIDQYWRTVWIEVARCLITSRVIDNNTVDHIIEHILKAQGDYTISKWGVQSFFKWNSMRKCVHGAFDELRRGGDPKFLSLPDKLLAICGVTRDDIDIARGWVIIDQLDS